MFTSRAEHRLYLREDNADTRLTPIGRDLGLVSDSSWRSYSLRQESLKSAIEFSENTCVGDVNVPEEYLDSKDNRGTKISAILRKPRVDAVSFFSEIGRSIKVSKSVLRRLGIELKYQGYIAREKAVINKSDKLESTLIPPGMAFAGLGGLSREIIEKLDRHRPETLGQASRISGITPAAIQVLNVHIKQSLRA
tara:strand:+ start:48 stop:629 length:582 start_codon:yes stop_codon:yes gene_type:complete